MYNLLFLNVQSDDPCKTGRITHDLKTSTNAQDHMTSNDSIQPQQVLPTNAQDHMTSNDSIQPQQVLHPQLQPHKELRTTIPLSPECLSSSEDHPMISAKNDDEHDVITSRSSVTKTTQIYASKPVSWDNLPCFLQPVIPSDEQYSYVIEECNELPAEKFSGAPNNRFSASLRINLSNGQEAKDWLDKMCNHSKYTY